MAAGTNTTDKYIHEIKVLGLEKIRKDISGKRYEFILRVKWSNNTEATIYRPHSMFFDFQGVLAEMFKSVKIPNAPVVRFHWALLGKLGNEKECKVMEDFCQKIIRLPPLVSKASIVLHFFETWGTDGRTNQKASELFDPEVGKASIQSTQERSKTATATGIEKEDQYRVITTYEATNIGETSLLEGTLVTIIEKNERGWWFVADDNGKQGWAPATYLEPLVASNSDEAGYDWVSVTDVNGEGEMYFSMVSYTAQNDDELSYAAGEEIEALQKSSYGWWKVRIRGEVGITPATNLQKVDNEDDTCLYQSADELKSRTVSISSAGGLYAVIRKPPPRRESVRSRTSLEYASIPSSETMPSPDATVAARGTGLTGKKPSRFVYSAASFSGGKFIIDDDNKENETVVAPAPRRASADDVLHAKPNSLRLRDTYENVEHENNNMQVGEKVLRSASIQEEQIDISNKKPYMNFKRTLDNDAEFYVTLLDYDPGPHRKDDIALSKGDIVQLISSDSGWMFVVLVKGEFEQQGWVPENYLERKPDVDGTSLSGKGSPMPKPRPRPAPRPRTKPGGHNSLTPDTQQRPSLPHVQVDELKSIERLREIANSRTAPATSHTAPPANRIGSTPPSVEEDLYDEPEMTLRSVYDAEPWYFGNITRADCERCLGTHGRQQEFLIRDSQRAKGSYALSVKYCYRIRHFPIQATRNRELAIGKLTFPNLMDIVGYYQKNPLFYSEHKEPITLGKAFTKDRI